MKNITIYSVVLFLTLTMISCGNSSVDTPIRPSDVPANVPPVWEHWHQEAYDQGRMSFNDDSTVMVILSERPSQFPEVNAFKIDSTLVK